MSVRVSEYFNVLSKYELFPSVVTKSYLWYIGLLNPSKNVFFIIGDVQTA